MLTNQAVTVPKKQRMLLRIRALNPQRITKSRMNADEAVERIILKMLKQAQRIASELSGSHCDVQ